MLYESRCENRVTSLHNLNNLNLLRTLKVLIDECHVSNAAVRLNITQSAVSRQLQQLRDCFTDPLLIRDGNRLVPTPKALELHTRVTRWLHELDDMLIDPQFDPNEWKGEFLLSSSDYVAQYILPDISQIFSQQAPKASIRYQLWQPNFITQLADSPIMLASSMSPEKPEGVESVQIGEDYPVCVMCSSHPLATQKHMDVDDFVAYKHVKVVGGGDKDSYVDEALGKMNLTRQFSLKVPFFYAACSCVANSDMLLVMPEHIARNMAQVFPLTYRTLPFETLLHKYWLIWHTRFDLEPFHLWARNIVLKAMRENIHSVYYDLKS